MKLRGKDQHGWGYYGAPRGSRKHRGVDICCESGDKIRAITSGEVTKIGFPYSQAPSQREDKKALRYVEITGADNIRVRYFYVSPSVAEGQPVRAGETIGTAQGVASVYPGITEHYHLETLVMVNGKKFFIDPLEYISYF